jgi:hypothetical protein
VKKKKYKGAVQGFVVEAGGRLGPAAKKFIDEVVAECEMSEAASKAAASKILRAIGADWDRSRAQAIYMTATLVQELRNEEQFMADFAHGVVLTMIVVYEGRRVEMIFNRWCFCAHSGFLGLSLIRSVGICNHGNRWQYCKTGRKNCPVAPTGPFS